VVPFTNLLPGKNLEGTASFISKLPKVGMTQVYAVLFGGDGEGRLEVGY
jgi:hypothetical protein